MAEIDELSREGGRAGRRSFKVETAEVGVAVWKGTEPEVCAAEAKASPSMAGELLCFR